MATTTLKVTGMTCHHCVMAVTKALRGVPGVRDAQVSLQEGRAVVDYDDVQASLAALVDAVEEEGYAAEAAGR
jgi:copper chaperone CopZ